MATTVVNSAQGARCDVDIRRPSKWGNPYVIGKDGDRATCILKYKEHIAQRPDLLEAIVPELKDRVLGCCCKPNHVCHGDYLAHLADNPDKIEDLLHAARILASMSFASKKPKVVQEPEVLDATSPEVQQLLDLPVVEAPPIKTRPLARPRAEAVELDDFDLEPLAPLSEEQQAVVEAILLAEPGDVIIVTGRAGSGKSHIVKHLRRIARITVCATTAKAALLVGGMTLDSLFVYSRRANGCWDPSLLQKRMSRAAKIITVDEGSMSGEKMSDYIYQCSRVYGKVLVIFGDWAQAAPVEDKWFFDTDLYAAAKIFHLKESHRQNEQQFLDALDALRRGVVASPLYDVFKPCITCGLDKELANDREVTQVMATNAEVDRHNKRMMDLIEKTHPDVYLDAFAYDLRPDRVKQKHPRRPGFFAEKVKNSPMAHGEVMRIGVRIMITMNLNQDGYVNGDTGKLLDVLLERDIGHEYRTLEAVGPAHYELRSPERPTGAPPDPPPAWLSEYNKGIFAVDPRDVKAMLIQVERTGEIYLMYRARLEVSEVGFEASTAIVGFPVAMAFAVTGHKVQGTTLDRIYVHMGSILRMRTRDSMHGLAYVMLSRCRTLEGLKIERWVPEAIHCDPICLPLVDPESSVAVEAERRRRDQRRREAERWNTAPLGSCDCCYSELKHVLTCHCGAQVCRDCATRAFPETCPSCTREKASATMATETELF